MHRLTPDLTRANPVQLHITTCQAENTFAITAALADVLTKAIGHNVQLVDQIPWQERFDRFEQGVIELVWICGWLIENHWRRKDSPAVFLAAPVLSLPRYGGHPIYYSEMIVRADSRFHTIDALRGATLAVNEPQSLSGFHAIRYFLHQSGLKGDHFSRVIMSGSHLRSIQAVRQGKAATAAIDSTLLDWYRVNEPAKCRGLRTIASIGPFPIPPLAIHRKVAPELRARIRENLCRLHESPGGQKLLRQGGLERFIDYDWHRERISAISQEIAHVSLRIDLES